MLIGEKYEKIRALLQHRIYTGCKIFIKFTTNDYLLFLVWSLQCLLKSAKHTKSHLLSGDYRELG